MLKDIEILLVGFVLAHDAFWIMDVVGDHSADRLAKQWHTMARDAGWIVRPSFIGRKVA